MGIVNFIFRVKHIILWLLDDTMNFLTKIPAFWFFVPLFVTGLIATATFAVESGLFGSVLGCGLVGGYLAMGIGGMYLLQPLFNSMEKYIGSKTNFSQQLHAYTFGIFLALAITSISGFVPVLSVLSEPFQIGTLLSTATESLGTFDQALAITVMSPLMETPIFIAHFFFSLVLVYAFGKAFKLSEGTRNILLLVSYIILSSVTFYHFHVGLVGTIPFLISVIVYRGMMGIFIFGDKLFNIIPFLTLAIGMEWGFHWMLNIQNYTGFINWVSIMLTNQLGVLALTVFVSLLGLEVLNIAMKGGGNNQ